MNTRNNCKQSSLKKVAVLFFFFFSQAKTKSNVRKSFTRTPRSECRFAMFVAVISMHKQREQTRERGRDDANLSLLLLTDLTFEFKRFPFVNIFFARSLGIARIKKTTTKSKVKRTLQMKEIESVRRWEERGRLFEMVRTKRSWSLACFSDNLLCKKQACVCMCVCMRCGVSFHFIALMFFYAENTHFFSRISDAVCASWLASFVIFLLFYFFLVHFWREQKVKCSIAKVWNAILKWFCTPQSHVFLLCSPLWNHIFSQLV